MLLNNLLKKGELRENKRVMSPLVPCANPRDPIIKNSLIIFLTYSSDEKGDSEIWLKAIKLNNLLFQ
jgi:hypothetical protein